MDKIETRDTSSITLSNHDSIARSQVPYNYVLHITAHTQWQSETDVACPRIIRQCRRIYFLWVGSNASENCSLSLADLQKVEEVELKDNTVFSKCSSSVYLWTSWLHEACSIPLLYRAGREWFLTPYSDGSLHGNLPSLPATLRRMGCTPRRAPTAWANTVVHGRAMLCNG